MSGTSEYSCNLRPLWDAILEVYRVVASLCDRHNLRYCADCGTALGAVRHGGFIPWDDDMDIQMPRPDYEKFVEIAKRELPEGYAWLDRFTCADYDNAFGKVIVTDSARVDKVAADSGLKLGEGIFIDIFPVDGYPNSWIVRVWRRFQNHLLGFRAKYNDGWNGCTTWKSKLAWLCGAVLLPVNYKIRNYREQVEFFEARAKKYVFGKTAMCVSIGCAHYADDKPYPFKLFGTPKKVKFDSVEMPVQEHVEEYLKWMFGDYMRLPPVERRKGSHGDTDVVTWRLGPGKCVI